MKEFDLEKALDGDKVITRDSSEATDLAYFESSDSAYKVCAVVDGQIRSFTMKGQFNEGLNSVLDLFMAPIKKEGWVDKSYVRGTKDELLEYSDMNSIIKVEWEE